jgi:hypothetical protein
MQTTSQKWHFCHGIVAGAGWQVTSPMQQLSEHPRCTPSSKGFVQIPDFDGKKLRFELRFE